MIEALFFLPVAAKDVNRAAYAVRSIRKFCERYRIYLLLDGCEASSLPHELHDHDVRIFSASEPSKGHWGKIWILYIRAMVEASWEDDVSASAIFVKFDTDALIIREGFTERAHRIFSTRPAAGQLGQIFSNVRGGRLANAGWSNYFDKMMGWRGLRQFIRSALKEGKSLQTGFQAYWYFKALVKGAVENGYVLGEFCIGGCFILRRELIAGMMERVLLDKSPFGILTIGDDVIMTLYVYWLGFAAMDDTSDGGLFGIEAQPFRVDPFILRERGHYVLHALKYGHHRDGHNLSEEELISALMRP